MEAQVCNLTLLTAVVDLVALAVKCEFLKLITVTALSIDGEWCVQLLLVAVHLDVVRLLSYFAI